MFALLARVGLLDLFFNHSIDRAADGGNVGARHTELFCLLQAR